MKRAQLTEEIAKQRILEKLQSTGLSIRFVKFTGNGWIGAKDTIIELYCEKHQCSFLVDYNHLAYKKNFLGCPHCSLEHFSIKKRKFTNRDDVISAINKKIEELRETNNVDLEFIGFIDKYEDLLLNSKIQVRCKKHNIVGTPTVQRFLVRGYMCKECTSEYNSKRFKSKKEEIYSKILDFKKESNYDFSSVLEENSTIEDSENPKIKIICKNHGPFYRNLRTILSLNSPCICPECLEDKKLDEKTDRYLNNIKKTIEERNNCGFDFDFVGFHNSVSTINNTAIDIKCNKHGTITSTYLYNFVSNISLGCKECANELMSSVPENKCYYYLLNEFSDLTIKRQHKIEHNHIYDSGEFSNRSLYVDFYIPEINSIIEYNGEQHYKFIKLFYKTEKEFIEQINRDSYLRNYCRANKINLLVLPYVDKDRLEDIIHEFVTSGKDITTKLEVQWIRQD